MQYDKIFPRDSEDIKERIYDIEIQKVVTLGGHDIRVGWVKVAEGVQSINHPWRFNLGSPNNL